MAIRLVALDLDGTLMGETGVISPRVRAAVGEAQARGIHVTLATGRSYPGTRAFARDLGITTPLVLFQGALIVEAATGRPLYRVTMPRDLAIEAIDLARERGWHLVIYDLESAYVEKILLPAGFYQALIQPDVLRVPDLREGPFDETVKFLIVAEPAAVPGIERELRDHFGDRAVIVRSHAFFVEGNPLGVSKARGLEWLAAHLGVPREAVLAVGDADNDVPMITWAGVGVAMGNASPAARAAADWVAPPLAEDGAAQAIERFALDGKGP